MKRNMAIAMLIVAVACSAAWCDDSAKTEGKVEEPRSGWMGVRLSPVGPPLKAHLQLKDKGVMIENIVEGSPADKAGLEQFDVIVSLEGLDVSDKVDEFVAAVRRCPPGDNLKLGVLRQAKMKEVLVTLGKPMPIGQAKLKYKSQTGIVRHDFMRMRPHMLLRKGPEGWLKMKETELPKELQKLLKDKEKLFGGIIGLRIPEVRVEPDQSTIEMTVGDETTRIEIDGDGKITVTKITKDKDGKEKKTTTKYESPDKLPEVIPDPFKMLGGPGLKILTSPGAAIGKKRAGGTEFSVADDGSITVRTEKGRELLVREFKNEQDLKKRAPKLHQQYRKLYE